MLPFENENTSVHWESGFWSRLRVYLEGLSPVVNDWLPVSASHCNLCRESYVLWLIIHGLVFKEINHCEPLGFAAPFELYCTSD